MLTCWLITKPAKCSQGHLGLLVQLCRLSLLIRDKRLSCGWETRATLFLGWNVIVRITQTYWMSCRGVHFQQLSLFTRAGNSHDRVSVRLCVCLCVTRRYCIKTAKRRITQTTPRDISENLVFWRQNSLVDDPLPPEICAQSDPPPFKQRNLTNICW